MARPTKKGVDYFSHDTKIAGKTLFTLEQTYGNDGYAFWFKLLEILGEQDGLYFDCNNPANWLYLLAKVRTTEEKAEEIMSLLVKLEAIDCELWKQKRVVWVQKFVDRLTGLFEKRKTETPQKPSFCSDNPTTDEFPTRKPPKNEVSPAESTQRKEEKSKGEESKGERSEFTHAEPNPILDFYLPSLDELRCYAEGIGFTNFNPQYFLDWHLGKGLKLYNWQATVRTWFAKERIKTTAPPLSARKRAF